MQVTLLGRLNTIQGGHYFLLALRLGFQNFFALSVFNQYVGALFLSLFGYKIIK